jgi:hypothetical protein
MNRPNLSLLYLILLFTFAGFITTAIGQTGGTATLYGIITDKINHPIADVRIAVGANKTAATSNANGEYSLTLPADTNLMIEFSHVSFGIRIKSVKLLKGEKTQSNISIDAIKILDTVVVLDKQAQANFIQSIAIKNSYVQTGASQDFNTILFTQLGVQQSNELSSSYSVRGGNFDENLVYVNDIEVYRPFLVHSGQQEGLSFVNSDMVSSINFSSGGFEARYGDKMSSVLDIRYTKPKEFSGSVSGGLLGGSVHLQGANKSKRFTYLVGARSKANSYLLNSLDTKADYKPLFLDIQSYLTYNPTHEWEHAILTHASQNKYRMIPQSRTASFGTINEAKQLYIKFFGQEVDDYTTSMAAYTATYRPYDKNLSLKLITSYFQTNERETFDVLGVYDINALENDFGKDNFGQTKYKIGSGGMLNHARNYLDAQVVNVEHKGNKQWHKHTNQLWWGAKVQHETINDKLSEWALVDSAGFSLPHILDSVGYTNPMAQAYQYLPIHSVVKSKNNLSSNRYSAYLQHAWAWTTAAKQKEDSSKTTLENEYTLTSGIRANYWDVNEQLLISPRATLSVKPHWNNKLIIKASVGFYYQPPFYRELRNLYGVVNTTLKAQQSIHYVVGIDKQLTLWNRPFKYTAELYYKQFNHLIPYEIDNVRIRYSASNNAKGYAGGLDMKLNGEFVKGVDSWASISIMKTMENISNDYYFLPGSSIAQIPGFIPRPMDQRVTFGLFFQDYLPKLPRCKMHMNLLYGTGLPFGPPDFNRYKDTLRMPPYRRVDIGFSYELIKEKEATAHRSFFFTNKIKSIWFSIEVFNLLAVNNVVSYVWIKDVRGAQYAVPNYLSNRMLNARVQIKF